MIQFLNDNPGVLVFLNCCVGPLVCIAFGFLIGRYRPRLRLPFTMDPDQPAEF